MKTGRPKVPIKLSKEEREQLQAIANSRSLPHALVNRVRIVLMAAEGLPNLWIPGADCFREVTEFPVLASGKLDLRAVKALAQPTPQVLMPAFRFSGLANRS